MTVENYIKIREQTPEYERKQKQLPQNSWVKFYTTFADIHANFA